MGGLRIPLFLIGAVALLSGGLKARERTRAYYGGVGMGLVEILVGVACMAATMPGVANNDTMVWLMFLAGGVIFVSTLSRAFKASRLRKGREDSESRRLYSQIKYAEALDGAADPPERLPGDEPPIT